MEFYNQLTSMNVSMLMGMNKKILVRYGNCLNLLFELTFFMSDF